MSDKLVLIPPDKDRPAGLRDQFAMAAITGILAFNAVGDVRARAREAYEIADAMLVERAAVEAGR